MDAVISHVSNRKACSEMRQREKGVMSTPGLSHPCNQTEIYAPRFPEGESLLVEIPTFILAEQEDGGRNCFPRT